MYRAFPFSKVSLLKVEEGLTAGLSFAMRLKRLSKAVTSLFSQLGRMETNVMTWFLMGSGLTV